jgi:hypothetical protein
MMPAISEAAKRPTVPEAAFAYADLRISILPCRGKEPGLRSWKQFQERRPSRTLIQLWAQNGLLQNVGLICGAVSENLVVIDLDGVEAVAAFCQRFPHLIDTYTVTSGSGNGAHLYFRPEILPPTTRVTGTSGGNVELRANGCYVVAPPSIHPSGKPYTIARPLPIMRLHELGDVVDWIKRLIAIKHGGQMPAPAGKHRPPVTNVSARAQAALRYESANVRAALPGTRNNTLNRAAFKLGQLVGAGEISRSEVENALHAAAGALAATDGEMTVTRTIRSGLEAGIRNPRRGS